MRDDDVMIERLDPTFLFTWKGTRKRDEKNYHKHDYIEICYILSGHGKYRLNDEVVDVTEGDLLILNPGVMHQALCTDLDNPTTEFFVGFADVQFAGHFLNEMPLPNGQLVLHTKGELRQRLFKLCASMEAENAVAWQGRYYMMKAYLIQMLLYIIREHTEPLKVKTGYSFESVNKKYVVEQIVGYFEDHYSEKVSLDQIAENMYLSPFYVSKIFKSETGEAPIRHLINIRLEKAKEILENGWDGSIQEVAAKVGYDDAYHFSKLFKKRYGVSPSMVKRMEKV